MARSAIPVLPSADLEVTETFCAQLGFEVAHRFDGYLRLHDGPVEAHFALLAPAARRPPNAGNPADRSMWGTCFVHVQDAVRYWKQLRDRDATGVQPPQQQTYGLVEFVVTDPFGNQIRFGSPTL